MKFQLALLLVVVLFVSLPSVVFSQPAIPGEAPTKTWEGPVFGLGLGLGIARATFEDFGGGSTDSPLIGVLPIRVRLGYGLSNSMILYGVVSGYNAIGRDTWSPPSGALGMMYRTSRTSKYYGLFAIGGSLVEDDWGDRYFSVRGGSGLEVHPGLSVEGACSVEYLPYEGGSETAVILDLTFNYHFY